MDIVQILNQVKSPFTDEQIEYLYKTGKMPQWAYFQQNGKTAQENFNTYLLER